MVTRRFRLEEVIPLRIASVEFNVPHSQLRSWHRRKFLSPVARLPASVPGGGVLVFLRADIKKLVDDPPRRGRRHSDEALPVPVIDVESGGGL